MSRPQPPELTAESRRAGQAKSLQLRKARAQVKRQLSGGNLTIIGCFAYAEEFPYIAGMKVIDLLLALPGVGQRRALMYLEAAGMTVKTTVRACGPKQREKLFALLNK